MPPHLAGGITGPDHLRPLLDTVLRALTDGATARGGPLPAGGPGTVAQHMHDACTPVIPRTGTGEEHALRTLVQALAAGAADPAEPHCAAHLHCPPLAVAVAADLAASALNPSLDSWDQAPAATALEAETTAALAALVYPGHPAPDALITTGGTESNQLALLLARERHPAGPPLQVMCGANAHHSIQRATWLLGLPPAIVLPTPAGTLDPNTLHTALSRLQDNSPVLVVATAGTTDTGAIDPLPETARITAAHRAELHIDAAYGGPLLFSDREAHRLDGLTSAASVTLDLHKLGWQPVAAGLLAVPDTTALRPLSHQADYLNAADDTEAGLPDLLGRSLRTTRRPDVLKIAVTLRALGRDGLGALINTVCDQAHHLADLIDAHPGLTLWARPQISTVLFRPTHADDTHIAAIRRRLLHTGHAVLGRAHADGRLWLKATLLNPNTRPADLTALLHLTTEGTTAR
ncbi:pyridoxal-dependent decarboxylase [Streptomyces sp. H10-C2]|uniref:pyridoxal phosphate-dependent decarboxylase family protein n=1 Tax=unclassified Streptomyces TaxID=2593676 RepID=UPI0024BB1965|nr:MULTISPECIES: pyridoxal-dependent decarboxylase [unclassified Streptomyces]MDJ0344493.1 pyridoxal-dependent decarboxylase [Streptomyces sp. PH10-H1]MDJ0369633.1 pyridoxal-dependent decarboxylase [Streptomyces sp. H10-C2]